MSAEADSISSVALWGLMAGGAVLFGLVGWFVVVIAERGAAGNLQRHGWMGIRTKASQSSDEAWLAAHKAGRARTVLGAGPMAASGMAAACLGLLVGFGDSERAILAWAISLSILPLIAAVPVASGCRQGDQAAKEVTGSGVT